MQRHGKRSAATLTKAQRGTRALGVRWRNGENGAETSFSHVWLRDNCMCPECLHPKTLQRQIDTRKLSEDLAPVDVHIDGQGHELRVTWSEEDGKQHKSTYSAEWLVAKATNVEAQRVKPSPWDRESIMGLGSPEVSYEEVMSGTEGMAKWVRMLHTHGYSIVTGTPATAEATQQVMAQFGPAKNGLFGLLWDFTVHAEASQDSLEHSDTAYTPVALQPHSDGCYCVEPPGLQAFHILEHTGQGGATVLVDGFNVAARLRAHNPDAFDYLANTPITFHYWDVDNFLEARQRIITLDPNGEVTRFVYNNDDRSPVYLPPEQADRHYAAIRALLREVQSPANQHTFRLSPGRMLVTNNWRVMHGRTAFTGSRRLSGSYLSMDHFGSRTRTLLHSQGLH